MPFWRSGNWTALSRKRWIAGYLTSRASALKNQPDNPQQRSAKPQANSFEASQAYFAVDGCSDGDARFRRAASSAELSALQDASRKLIRNADVHRMWS